MPLIELYQNVKFMVNFRDHNPPHFHVRDSGTGYEASFLISDGQLLVGEKPDSKTKKIVRAWWAINKDKLENIWGEYSE